VIDVARDCSLTLTFEGGTDTIGGNAVILRANKKETAFQYLFDFGVPMDEYRSQQMLHSTPKTLVEFSRRGLISEFDMNFRACFLSHAHPDHSVVIPALYLSKNRPEAIWASKTTSRIVDSVRFVEKPLHIDPFEKSDYYQDSAAQDEGLDIRVALYPVDHDVPGACSFFIIAEDSLIIYTGDFRDHGFLSDVIKRQFWDYAKLLQSKNRFLSCTVICEGTNFGLPFDFRPQRDFDDRMKEIYKVYANDLVSLIVNQDGLWDLFSAIRITKTEKVDRQIVLSKTLRKFLDRIRNSFLEDYQRVVSAEGLAAFQAMMNLDQFKVYDPRREDYLDILRKISENPSDYLLFLTRNDAFDALEKIAMFSGKVGGCCVLSFSAYEGTSDSVTRTFAEAIGHIGFCVEKTNVLARGHVSPHRLVDILHIIKPSKVFVMHTLAPEGLKAFLESHLNCEIIAPTRGTPYNI
jgi:mRNA degradation ribonuclease J1/J2